jgi:hypothetical protein
MTFETPRGVEGPAPTKNRLRRLISRLPSLTPASRGMLTTGLILLFFLGFAATFFATQPAGFGGGGAAGVAVGIVVMIASAGGLGIVSVAPRPNPPPTLQERIATMAASLHESAGLVEQISTEVEAREKMVLAMEARAQAAEDSVRLNEEAAAAVSRILDVRFQKAEKRTRRDGVVGFIFGVVATYLITLLVHPLH